MTCTRFGNAIICTSPWVMNEHEKRLRDALAAGPTIGKLSVYHDHGWLVIGDEREDVYLPVSKGTGVAKAPMAQVISTAVNAAPALLSDLDALRRERDELRAECERLSAGHATALVALAEARAEVERLTRELAEARADAGRYRWLRRADGDWGICEFDQKTSEWVRDSRGAAVVDAAIDAAREAANV